MIMIPFFQNTESAVRNIIYMTITEIDIMIVNLFCMTIFIILKIYKC